MINGNGEYEGLVYRYYITDSEGREMSYIGQTTNEKKRISCWNSSKNKYGGCKIEEARRTYGIKAFKYEVLEKVEVKNQKELTVRLAELESYYIRTFNSVEQGFNMSLGKGTKGIVMSEETRRKIGKGHEKFGVLVIDTATGKEMLFSSMSDAARNLEIRASNIFYYLHMGIEKHGYKIKKAA